MDLEEIIACEPPTLLMIEKAYSPRIPSAFYTFSALKLRNGWFVTGQSRGKNMTDEEFHEWLSLGSRLAPAPRVFHAKVVYEI